MSSPRGGWRGGRGGWREGSEKRGGRGGQQTIWRRGNNTSSGKVTARTQTCWYYRRGRCHHGSACRYRHDDGSESDSSTEANSTKPRKTVRQEDSLARHDYLEFKRQLRQLAQLPFAAPQDRLLRVWKQALAVLNSHEQEREWPLSLATDLADSDVGGPSVIKKTIQACMEESSHTPRSELSTLFLQVITHHLLLDSLSIESFVGVIYRLFSGVDGDQGISFLSSIVDGATQFGKHRGSHESLILVVSALHELLRRERRCLLNDALGPLFVSLEDGLNNFPTGLFDVQVASSRLSIMRRMHDSERQRLLVSGKDDQKSRSSMHVLSTFPADVQLPGGHHDNDLLDITNIQIFPTVGEVTSTGVEFLPTTNLQQHHFLGDPVRRHIDTAFRLLRHDIFGPLKEIAGSFLAQGEHLQSNHPSPPVIGSTRANTYGRASIQDIFIENKTGLEAILSLATPPQIQKLSLDKQRTWWRESSNLDEGRLICYISCNHGESSFLLFVVTNKNTTSLRDDDSVNKSSVVSGYLPPTVTVKLATETESQLSLLSRTYVEKRQGIVIELPGLIPDTFVPILQSLQRMMQEGNLAFHNWILPSPKTSIDQPFFDIPPPVYARRADFRFRLRSITRQGHMAMEIDPSSPAAVDMQALSRGTGLDRGQCHGLVAALTREYAMIQGPPGTGKSHVGVQLVRLLLDHKKESRLGPIVIICYTNHALDQFLKHLLDVGIDRIIRIGGQSRTEELAGKNLRVVSRTEANTMVETGILSEHFASRDSWFSDANTVMDPIHSAREDKFSSDLLLPFLERSYPEIAAQFTFEDDEGFELVGAGRIEVWLGKTKPFRSSCSPGPPESMQRLLSAAERDVWGVPIHERWALAESWCAEMIAQSSGHLFEALDQARACQQRIRRVYDDLHRRTLLKADVIGLTTNGLARNIEMLRCIKSKVIICEEAGEVKEPDILPALIPGVEHFIQIGDHRQLRPQIQNYLRFSLETSVGQAYQLDRSQFERRAVGEPGLGPLPVAQLNVQRRMRPEISSLIRSVYPNLEDHASVEDYPNVAGMRHNLFWLDHDHPEESRADRARLTSHSNDWEVSMAIALVHHLVRQGEYSSRDVALLTPYTGQLQKLKAALSKDFEIFLSDRDLDTLALGKMEIQVSDDDEPAEIRAKTIEKKQLLQTIRLATVDNFQGEEAKIIIVSLVRSNSDSKVGFLRTENRINVLLSRAKHGMYLIGNTKTYLHIPMWATVFHQLKDADAVGRALELCCPRHKDTAMFCETPSDFARLSPEGGCALICDQRLEPCGHRCPAPCHSEALHYAFSCLQPCPRLHDTCQHSCPKLCGEHCGPCRVRIKDVELPCGHTLDQLECHRTLDLTYVRCSHPVEKTVPGCEHRITVDCSMDVASQGFHCPTKCDHTLDCGHGCAGSCGRCRLLDDEDLVVYAHKPCKQLCKRPYGTCTHTCPEFCHDGTGCGTCEKRCEVRCPHSRCSMACQKPCTPCIEKCAWSCEHRGTCSLPCAAPCDRLPCDRRCELILACGHQCPSFCGEVCPVHMCQACCDPHHKNARVDLLEFKSYSQIDIDETPIVLLACGHFFTGETLDGMVGMSQVYTTDSQGEYNGLGDLSGAFLGAVPTCPDCRVPIRQFSTRRYNRVVNKAVMDETMKRFLVHGRQELHKLQERFDDAEKTLALSREKLRASAAATTPNRYAEMSRVNHETGQLRRAMTAEHQPVRKLFDAMVAYQRGSANTKDIGSLEQGVKGLDISKRPSTPERTPSQPVYNQQVTLEAGLLQLNVQEAILRDKFTLLAEQKSLSVLSFTLSHEVDPFFEDCQTVFGQSLKASLPRLAIQATLLFARLTQLESWCLRKCTAMGIKTQLAAPVASGRIEKPETTKESRPETATKLLADALVLCETFGAGGAEFRTQVEETMRVFDGPRYQEVTPEEIAAIKSAMIGGQGISTHSGHWYNCENGHPFAIGECGMPMEEARCPDCGARIGGQHHEFVGGVSRATNME